MKKLFLSSLVLLFFAASVTIFQVSCKKEAIAQTNSNSQQGIILYAIGYGGGPGYPNSAAAEYWTMNYDGTNAKKVPLTFSSAYWYSMYPKLSPDGKTIFFTANDMNYNSYMFSCSIDGTNLKTLLIQNQKEGSGANIEVAGAY